VKYCLHLRGLACATGLLLPWWAAAESQLQAGTVNGKTSAAAHVDFRIVIPPVLSLGLTGGDAPTGGAQKVVIFSNNRNVTLSASAATRPAARSNLILRAAARKVIAREAACQLPTDASPDIASKTDTMICTVSMP
jgi:hypothetical protein